jgi:hypothetical protein
MIGLGKETRKVIGNLPLGLRKLLTKPGGDRRGPNIFSTYDSVYRTTYQKKTIASANDIYFAYFFRTAHNQQKKARQAFCCTDMRISYYLNVRVRKNNMGSVSDIELFTSHACGRIYEYFVRCIIDFAGA